MPPVRVLQAAVLTGTVLATVVSGAVTGAASAAPSATTEPAGAVGAADPNAGFMDPPDVVPVGWDGLLTYGWLNYDVTQRFTVEVTGPGYELRQRIRIPEGTSVRRRVRVGPLTAAGDHRAVFRDRSGGTVFAHDFVVAAPVDLRVAHPARPRSGPSSATGSATRPPCRSRSTAPRRSRAGCWTPPGGPCGRWTSGSARPGSSTAGCGTAGPGTPVPSAVATS